LKKSQQKYIAPGTQVTLPDGRQGTVVTCAVLIEGLNGYHVHVNVESSNMWPFPEYVTIHRSELKETPVEYEEAPF